MTLLKRYYEITNFLEETKVGCRNNDLVTSLSRNNE